MPETRRDIYDNKSQFLHQVGTSRYFHIWCMVTHTPVSWLWRIPINVHNCCPRGIGDSCLITNNVSCGNYWASSQNEMSRCSCRSAFSQLQDLNRWPWSVGSIFWTRCTCLCSRPVGICLGCHFPYSLLRNTMTLTTFRALRQEWLRIICMKFYFLNFFCLIHISSIESSSISRLSLVLYSGSSIRITCSQSLWKRI